MSNWEDAPTIKRESSGWEDAPSKSAPKDSAPEPEGLLTKAAPYVTGTATAGLIGAATPEILTAAGMFPSPMSPFLLAGGQMARTGRMGAALASSGGYLAGQAAKKVTPEKEKTAISFPGVNITRGDIAETAGEILAPAAATGAKKFVTGSAPYKALMAAAEDKGIQSGSTKTAANELANFRNRVPINQVLNTERLRSSPNDIAAYEKVLNKLKEADADTQKRIAADLANAQAQADSILFNYSRQAESALRTNKDLAQRLINEGDVKAKKVIDDALNDANRKAGIRSRAQAAGGVAEKRPQETLQQVGNSEAFESATGGSIQQRINQVVSDEQKALNTAYNTAKDDVSKIVNAKQSQGIGVAQTPAYKAITNYLDQKLGKNEFAKAPFKQTVEPTLVQSLTNIRNAVGGFKNAVDETGKLVEVAGKTPSFEALDEVRRKLGDVFAGKEVEGFKNISKEQARELYKLVREAQVEYTGGTDGAFDMMLRNYSEGKDLLNALKIPAGKKIINKDLINPEYFTYDPSGLPREFFSTRKKVEDLINLTKDKGFVEQQASNHVARVLKDADAKTVKQYMEKNAEWLDLLPSLKSRLQDHYAAVSRAGSVVPKTEKLAGALKTEIKNLPITAQTEAKRIRNEAGKAADEAIVAGKKQAKELTTKGKEEAGKVQFPNEKFEALVGKGDTITQIRKLITDGNTDKLRRASEVIKSDPQVSAAFKQAVKQELSQLDPRNLAGGKNARSEWETKLKPALLETGLIDDKLAKEVSERMKVVQLTMEPSQKAQALFFVLRQALSGKLGELTGAE
jgi:hypothetical protein